MAERYRNSVVTFLDILGFREIIKSENAQQVSDMLDALGETAAVPVGIGGDLTKVISFSDSVIRVRPTTPESSYEALLHEVQDLAVAQWTLLGVGILLRGGITIGKAATALGRAYGPAFVRAYDLESSLASAPRIVIDPVVITELRKHIRNEPRSARTKLIQEIKSHLRQGSDGIWFVDYVSTVVAINLPRTDVESSLRQFKSIIIEKTNEVEPSSLVLPKFLWLVKYHNYSCKRQFPKDKTLKITRIDVPLSDELLRPITLN